MKQVAAVVFACVLGLAFPGLSQKVREPHAGGQVDYYLDSVRAENIKYFFFDVNDVANVRVEKSGSRGSAAGKIYIRSKHPSGFYWMSPGELEKQYAKTSPLTIFMINNEILRDDVAMYKIDSSYILKVEVIKSSDIQTLKNQVPTLTFVNILTKTKENLAKNIKPSGIIIRGAETAQL